MPKINVLDKSVAELIAAGEVVERPSSIVKELLENCVDAGATDISVEISGGGVRMIRVSDNGCGISREDMPKAFLRHATSKICEAQDLDSIFTLGFRGEALASVAAVCRVELTSKTAAEDEGTAITAEGGIVTGCVPVGRPDGTTITVRDVFFNTPARMKFLKKDVAEGNSVALVVDKLALSHPEIAFKFVRDGVTRLKTSGNGDLLAVIYEIYGREFANEMLAVNYLYEDSIRVTGYISKPSGVKPGRSYQNFYINGRFVKTKTCMAALEEAYKNKIMSGKYPACVLNLGLDASSVDINAHPAKIEVRFVNEKPIFSSVYYAVKTTLAKLETPLGISEAVTTAKTTFTAVSSVEQQCLETEHISAGEFRARYVPEQAKQAQTTQLPKYFGERVAVFDNLASKPVTLHSPLLDIEVDDDGTDIKFSPKADFCKKIPDNGVKISKEYAINEVKTDTNTMETAEIAAFSPKTSGFRIIGEAFGTYVLLEDGDELVLVDKHAAHERIIYERLKRDISYGNRQILLCPQNIVLSRDEHTVLAENLHEAEKLGFFIEDFGGSSVVVREVPIELAENDVVFILRELAVNLKNNKLDLTPHVLDRLYYSIACRSAVKAGDKNSTAELTELMRQLEANPSITHCPHGRPVLVRLTRTELEKMFGRLG